LLINYKNAKEMMFIGMILAVTAAIFIKDVIIMRRGGIIAMAIG